jgi:hypothetical protein
MTSPRRADGYEVALHFLIGAAAPPRQEGEFAWGRIHFATGTLSRGVGYISRPRLYCVRQDSSRD